MKPPHNIPTPLIPENPQTAGGGRPAPACSRSSDTPETDAESVTIETDGTTIIRDWVSVEFARKLERERDEARKWNAEGKINGSRCAEERDRLQDAIRAYQKTDGLYPTTREAALRRIYSLLPENADMRRDAEDVRPT